MQIKLIAEGSTKFQRFIKRWGISFLIGEDVLFDTFGDEKIFFRNLRKFKIDINKIKYVIISHDHWDHTAGLWSILKQRKDVRVYVGANFSPVFREKVHACSTNVVEVKGFVRITEGVYSTGQIPGKYAGDDIFEQAVVVSTVTGFSLITGCAHPNIIKIVEHVKQQLDKTPYLVIGGLHLKDESIGSTKDTIKKLRQMGVLRISPLHCSGKNAVEYAKEEFREQYRKLTEGQSMDI